MILKLSSKKKIGSVGDVSSILYSILKREDKVDQDKEHFWVIGLNARNVISYVELVSLGTINANLIHPRETFRLAIMKGICSLIVAHNHNSGDTEPSEDDLKITKRLTEAGKIVGIEILDHIIIGRNQSDSVFSFKEKKLL